MGQICSDSVSNNGGFDLTIGTGGSQAVGFEPNKSTDGKANMVGLDNRAPKLSAFDTCELFQATTIL